MKDGSITAALRETAHESTSPVLSLWWCYLDKGSYKGGFEYVDLGFQGEHSHVFVSHCLISLSL